MCVTHHVMHYSIQMYLCYYYVLLHIHMYYVECTVHVPHVYTAYHTIYSICISAYSTPTRYSVTCHVTHTHVYYVMYVSIYTSYHTSHVMCNGITQYYITYICNGMYIHTTMCMCICVCTWYMYYYTLYIHM